MESVSEVNAFILLYLVVYRRSEICPLMCQTVFLFLLTPLPLPQPPPGGGGGEYIGITFSVCHPFSVSDFVGMVSPESVSYTHLTLPTRRTV